MTPELPDRPPGFAGSGTSSNRGYIIGWTIALIVFTLVLVWYAAR
jgi:hypothetical protein